MIISVYETQSLIFIISLKKHVLRRIQAIFKDYCNYDY